MRLGFWRMACSSGPHRGLLAAAMEAHAAAALSETLQGARPWQATMLNLDGAAHAHLERWLQEASAGRLREFAFFVTGTAGTPLSCHACMPRSLQYRPATAPLVLMFCLPLQLRHRRGAP